MILTKKEKLIDYLNKNGKTHSWVELADMFGLKQGFTNKEKSDYIRNLWRRSNNKNKKENFIDSAIVTKVKRWQLPNGEIRESIQYSPKEIENENLLSKIESHFKEYESPKPFFYKNSKTNDYCAIINLFDAHIDKLSLINEAKEDSSLETNISNFEKAFDELLSNCLTYSPEVIYLPVGSDFFNTNSIGDLPTTKRGTPQRVLGSQEDTFKIGISVYRRCIDKAAQFCKVVCPVIKGNHDEDKVFYLGTCLSIAYEGNDRVEIDDTRHQRKYYKYGKNLFGFAHGDKEKNKVHQLPLLMAEERKRDWADTDYREWYLGDIHHKQEYKFLRGQDFIGCTVRFLRSVGTSDKWHTDEGYVGVPATAEAFIWTKDKGLKANFQTNI
jgi:hypothetical protein